ncbi:hypothetical protein A6P54_00200 [Bacillus sp. MKU004]|nr:hypothetical protein A6P54_00200 [Bacillus sp. MKU004]
MAVLLSKKRIYYQEPPIYYQKKKYIIKNIIFILSIPSGVSCILLLDNCPFARETGTKTAPITKQAAVPLQTVGVLYFHVIEVFRTQ